MQVLISGVAQGIGRALLETFLLQGYKVLGLVRTHESQQEIESSLDSYASQLSIKVCDITSGEALYYLGEYLHKNKYEIDVLINNAGLGIGSGLLKNENIEEIRSFFDVNFFGTWRLYQTVDAFMKNGGRIINISSSMALEEGLKQGGYPAYRLSKWALNGFTIQLAAELRERNIKVVSVCPGWTKTRMGGENALKTIEQGIETIVWLCNDSEIETGEFYIDKKLVKLTKR